MKQVKFERALVHHIEGKNVRAFVQWTRQVSARELSLQNFDASLVPTTVSMAMMHNHAEMNRKNICERIECGTRPKSLCPQVPGWDENQTSVLVHIIYDANKGAYIPAPTN